VPYGGAFSTSGNAAVNAIAGSGTSAAGFAQSFGGGVIYNPAGSPAGQFSEDNFQNDIRPIQAGPSLTFRGPGGVSPSGLSIRRIQGGTDLSNVVVVCW
jgi:hypothetical protein